MALRSKHFVVFLTTSKIFCLGKGGEGGALSRFGEIPDVDMWNRRFDHEILILSPGLLLLLPHLGSIQLV